MGNFKESNTVQMVKNNYFFAKAAIGAVEGRTPFIRGIKKAGIALASGVIGLANLPITILKDELKDDTLTRKTLKFTLDEIKDVVLFKEIKGSEKVNLVGVGIAMYSMVNALVLPFSLIAAPLQGVMGEYDQNTGKQSAARPISKEKTIKERPPTKMPTNMQLSFA